MFGSNLGCVLDGYRSVYFVTPMGDNTLATSYPYASAGPLAKAFVQFRQSFPAVVNASTLKKFSIAPNNESYIISVLRFLGFIDDEGNRLDENVSYFYETDESFKSGLELTLRDAYKPLFDDFGEAALDKSKDDLIPWFRATDKSSQLVGGRQAATFTALTGLAGHGEAPVPPSGGGNSPQSTSPKSRSRKKQEPKEKDNPSTTSEGPAGTSQIIKAEPRLGLTVRVEVNLPAGGDESTYDAIFKSIRKNLIDGKS